MSGALTEVLAAVRRGAASRTAVAAATGLPRDVVDAAVDHLARLGRLDLTALPGGCAPSACTGCGFARGCVVRGRSAAAGDR